ncbi:MAG TPA: SgcJ/EcaC family oxidoreductase [Thermoanaerobaculia bacterium]|nr:SgcJ/EcaC family oxidoreductase [Thermoanaerobaculia bacterium]
MLRRSVLWVVLLLVAARAVRGDESPAESGCSGPLSARDALAIRAVIEAYRTAWLQGDAKAVLGTFTSDAVLLPARGAPWVAGTAAIMNYWWPPNAPATVITKLDITVEEVQGNCGVASVYGRDDVAWTQVEGGAARTHGHPGTYLNVLRRLPDGSWRIARHMWDDGASR